MSRRGWILFIAMGVIWGVPYLMIKVAVSEVTPATLVLARTAIAVVILVPIAAARGHLRPLLTRWAPLVAFAAVEMALPWFLLTSAEKRLTSSLAGLLIAAVPLVGALLGWVTGHDRLDGRRLLGLLIGITGVAALVGLDLGHGDLWALIQMTGVVLGYAVGPFILLRYLSDLPGLGVIAASLALTAAAYAAPGVAQLPDQMPRGTVVGAVLVLGLLCTAIAFLVFFALIDEVGPVRATVITYINPAVAIALGVLFVDEPMTVGLGVGFALVLLGSVLATRRAPAPRSAELERAPALVTEA
jgi:drug/metabolite transporter (DMT)-like permease